MYEPNFALEISYENQFSDFDYFKTGFRERFV